MHRLVSPALLGLVAALGLACSADATPDDAGAGSGPDAGPGGADAAPADTGPGIDAGTADAGAGDAGPLEPARLELEYAGQPVGARGTQLGTLRRHAPGAAYHLELVNRGGAAAVVTALEVDGHYTATTTVPARLEGGERLELTLRPLRTSELTLRAQLTVRAHAADAPATSLDLEFGVIVLFDPFVVRAPRPLPDIDAALDARLRDDALVGLGLVIADGADLVYVGARGRADLAADVAIDPERSLFRLAGLSQLVTAMAAVRLETVGRLDLDAEVSSLVPDYEVPPFWLPGNCRDVSCQAPLTEAERSITPRLLLHHLSGITHFGNGIGDPSPPTNQTDNPNTNTGIAWALPIWTGRPLVERPNTVASVSAFGYNLLGVVLERGESRGLASIVTSAVRERIGLETLRPDYLWVDEPERVSGYRQLGNTPVLNARDDVSWALPWGGFMASLEDLGRLCATLAAPGALTTAERDALRSSLAAAPDQGMALELGVLDAQPAARLSGSDPHAQTGLLWLPDAGICLVAVSNSDWAVPLSWLDELARSYLAVR
jgi:CubicO group peptidase (beta-lactamase class C family)